MKESYVEGLASHDDPESCMGARKGTREALTGARAGGAIELRNVNPAYGQALRGADAVSVGGRPHRASRHGKRRADPAQSKTSRRYGNISHGSREIPWPSTAQAADRIGKSKDRRR
jgi:hypothetical protein